MDKSDWKMIFVLDSFHYCTGFGGANSPSKALVGVTVKHRVQKNVDEIHRLFSECSFLALLLVRFR